MAATRKRIKIRITIDAWVDRDEWANEYGVPPDAAMKDVAAWFAELGPQNEGGSFLVTGGQVAVPLPQLTTITRARAKVE